MFRSMSGLLTVAALAGTAVAADEDTVRLGRVAPGEAVAADAKTLQATPGDDTALIHGYRRGFYGGLGYGYYGRSFYGGFYRPYYTGYYGGFYRPYFASYYYAPPVYYYTAPVYYDPFPCFSPGYFGALPIGGADAPTVPLRTNYFSEYLNASRPSPDTVVTAPQRATPVTPPPEDVRVSRPAEPTPSKYRYTAYGEK